MAEVHEERFIPERHKLDQVSIVKDYAAVPRLEYRYVLVVRLLLSQCENMLFAACSRFVPEILNMITPGVD